MPFDLYVTTPKGRQFKTLSSPYDDRESTTGSVRMILAGFREIADGSGFAELVAAHPLGETIVETVSGVGFRTEEI